MATTEGDCLLVANIVCFLLYLAKLHNISAKNIPKLKRLASVTPEFCTDLET